MRRPPDRHQTDHHPDGRELVKMSVLARISGVPAATIKHYVREGLLPEPARTSRNMAYYDVGVVARIRKIKELQRTRFLPLKVIKQVLDESALGSADETVAATIARVLEQGTRPTEVRTRDELLRSGMPEAQLDWLESMGVIAPVPGAGARSYSGDDLEILRVLGAARKAGLSAEMLPVEILGEYVQAMRALVRAELRLFREGVMPRAGGDLPALTEAATTLSERLVVLLRRKMLIPTLRALVDETKRASAPRPTEGSTANAAKKRRKTAPPPHPYRR